MGHVTPPGWVSQLPSRGVKKKDLRLMAEGTGHWDEGRCSEGHYFYPPDPCYIHRPGRRRRGQQTAGPVGSRKGDSRDLLISQKPGGGWAPTDLRAEHVPRETRSPQVSSITSRNRVLWSRSSCPHSSRVKVTATFLKVTTTWRVKHRRWCWCCALGWDKASHCWG